MPDSTDPGWFQILREDLKETRADVAALRTEVTSWFSNLVTQAELERDRRIAAEQHADLTADITAVKTEAEAATRILRRDFEADVAERKRQGKWLIGIFIAAIGAAGTAVAAIAAIYNTLLHP